MSIEQKPSGEIEYKTVRVPIGTCPPLVFPVNQSIVPPLSNSTTKIEIDHKKCSRQDTLKWGIINIGLSLHIHTHYSFLHGFYLTEISYYDKKDNLTLQQESLFPSFPEAIKFHNKFLMNLLPPCYKVHLLMTIPMSGAYPELLKDYNDYIHKDRISEIKSITLRVDEFTRKDCIQTSNGQINGELDLRFYELKKKFSISGGNYNFNQDITLPESRKAFIALYEKYDALIMILYCSTLPDSSSAGSINPTNSICTIS